MDHIAFRKNRTSPCHSRNILAQKSHLTEFIFDIYVGSLYLESKATSTNDIYNLKGQKSIGMHFLYDEVSKEKLVSGWNDGFEGNNSEDELAKLKTRIDQFNALFVTVKKGDVINGLDVADTDKTKVFHAGTALKDGKVVTAGGRVLCATALGQTVAEAQRMAYKTVNKINWQNMYYRDDIAYRAIEREQAK